MPSEPADPSSPANHQTPAGPSALPASALLRPRARNEDRLALRLAAANRALWTATLALMTAFMQSTAPAHRYLLARRIARNFETLSGQDCFDASCRATFGRLATRWEARPEQFSPHPPRRPRLFELLP
jgi:hypothetical protein